MKYTLRSLRIVVVLLPPALAGVWSGYRWLYPSFTPLPPPLREFTLEELNRAPWNEMSVGEPLFDPGGPPEPMGITSK
jgi:hypothetical protein